MSTYVYIQYTYYIPYCIHNGISTTIWNKYLCTIIMIIVAILAIKPIAAHLFSWFCHRSGTRKVEYKCFSMHSTQIIFLSYILLIAHSRVYSWSCVTQFLLRAAFLLLNISPGQTKLLYSFFFFFSAEAAASQRSYLWQQHCYFTLFIVHFTLDKFNGFFLLSLFGSLTCSWC